MWPHSTPRDHYLNNSKCSPILSDDFSYEHSVTLSSSGGKKSLHASTGHECRNRRMHTQSEDNKEDGKLHVHV